MFLQGAWATDTFITNYLPLVLFPVVYLATRYWRRTTFVRPEDMDFKTGLAEVEDTVATPLTDDLTTGSSFELSRTSKSIGIGWGLSA